MLEKAIKEYKDRQNRKSHPNGKFDSKSRWYPSEAEQQVCCSTIRQPSRTFPNSLNKHCRSLIHISNLFNVDEKQMRKELNKEKDFSVAKYTRYKKVAKISDKLYSIYDKDVEYILGKTLREKVPHLTYMEREGYDSLPHDGGFYIYNTIDEAKKAVFPKTSDNIDEEKVLIKCEVWGRHIKYSSGKEVWTYCKPLEVIN